MDMNNHASIKKLSRFINCLNLPFFFMIFLFLPFLLSSTIFENPPSNCTPIRSFDLGGGGLKTALFIYNYGTKKMKIKADSVTLLGKCPNDKELSDWIREKIPTLEEEIHQDFSFGFSLAGFDKLHDRLVKGLSISQLFELPAAKTSSIDDGGAHLLASLKMLNNKLPQGRVWNISLGTGVGFGFTNQKKEIKLSEDLYKFFEVSAWNVMDPTTNKPIYQVGSSKAFKAMLKEMGPDQALIKFAEIWQQFINQKIIDYSEFTGKDWAKPSAVVFTGGFIDYNNGKKLIEKLDSLGLKVPAFVGPKNAGLHGAAWNVIE